MSEPRAGRRQGQETIGKEKDQLPRRRGLRSWPHQTPMTTIELIEALAEYMVQSGVVPSADFQYPLATPPPFLRKARQ